jgi:predicted RNA-binding Zn-ribbon protein involved in translation (DUF1610 family)
VDLGVTSLAVFSDGRPPVPNPRHYQTSLRKLRRASRAVSRKQGPDRRTGARPSNRWRKANTARNRVQHRTTHLRRDAIHKLTRAWPPSTARSWPKTSTSPGWSVIAGWRGPSPMPGWIRRQLAYKTAWNGGHLEVADRWYPSSKTCSSCGAVKPKLPLRVRTFTCPLCGLVIDRDENAALNLAALIQRHVAQSGWETQNGRGADPKTAPDAAGGREASTPHRAAHRPDRTGTFAQQRANHREPLKTPVNGRTDQ